MKRRILDEGNTKVNKKAIAIIALISLVVVILSIVYANKRGKKLKEIPRETAIETAKETKLGTSKEVEDKINKEVEKEIKEIENKGLSKEEQEKAIKKAKEKIVERVAKENKVNKNNINNIVERNVSKRVESSDKINNEVKEKARETRKEAEKKISDTKPTQSSKPSKTKKEVKRTTETQSISFNTIDNYANTGGKSRVYQEGRNGERTIVKEDGKVVSNKVTRQAQDKIIERYVKVQSAEYKTVEKEVDDLSKPVYRIDSRDRWFVNNDLTGEKKYFYSAKEASDYMTDNEILGNWGTADPEIIKTDVLLGYEKKTVKEKVKVSDEVWKWKH